MPAKPLPNNEQAQQPSKSRPIRKANRAKHPSSPSLASLSDTDDITPSIQIYPAQPPLTKSSLLPLLRQLKTTLRYSSDTLLAALLILRQLPLPLCLGSDRLTAAALLEMAAKVHEYRTPIFANLTFWGGYSFGSEQLVRAEREILNHICFKIPSVLGCRSLREVEEAINRQEREMVAEEKSLSFQ